MRVSQRRRTINLATIEKYREATRAVRKAATGKTKDEALKALSLAFKQLDKAVKKRVIHQNKSSRLKSRLARSLAKLQ